MVLSIEKGATTDFELSDEVQSIDMPYFYFLNDTFIDIYSLLTMEKVKRVDFTVNMKDQIKKSLKFN